MGLGFSPSDTSSRNLIDGSHPDHPRKGRPKGARNKYKTEASELARNIIQSPEYMKKLIIRAEAGILPPAVEIMLWYYSYGKPLDRTELTLKDEAPDYSNYSAAQLAERATQLGEMLLLLAQESKEESEQN